MNIVNKSKFVKINDWRRETLQTEIGGKMYSATNILSRAHTTVNFINTRSPAVSNKFAPHVIQCDIWFATEMQI